MISPSPYLSGTSKRILDWSLALALFVPLHAVLFIAMVWMWLRGDRPLFYTQQRIGLHGRPFVLYKLRTLRADFDDTKGAVHEYGDITVTGHLLRKWRIDELPQYWNILRGEMSWVGPRPEVPVVYHRCCTMNPDFAQRQQALPGITGLSQWKNPDYTAEQSLLKLQDDMDYVRNAGLAMDLRILGQTLRALI
ncbi:MAG: sugar transferase [Bacteroidota bacterium]